MTVHLRVQGWLTEGAVVPVSTKAMVELVEHGRAQEAELVRLRARLHAVESAAEEAVKRVSDGSTVEEAHNALMALAATLKAAT